MPLNEGLICLGNFYVSFYMIQVFCDYLLEVSNVPRNIPYAILQRQNFVCFVFVTSVNAMYTENLVFSLTV